jgi:hypothetical protein
MVVAGVSAGLYSLIGSSGRECYWIVLLFVEASAEEKKEEEENGEESTVASSSHKHSKEHKASDSIQVFTPTVC